MCLLKTTKNFSLLTLALKIVFISYRLFQSVVVIVCLGCSLCRFLCLFIALCLHASRMLLICTVNRLPLCILFLHPFVARLCLCLGLFTVAFLVAPDVGLLGLFVIVWFAAFSADSTAFLLAPGIEGCITLTRIILSCADSIILVALLAKCCLYHFCLICSIERETLRREFCF